MLAPPAPAMGLLPPVTEPPPALLVLRPPTAVVVPPTLVLPPPLVPPAPDPQTVSRVAQKAASVTDPELRAARLSGIGLDDERRVERRALGRGVTRVGGVRR